jgi:glycosyltransferase involved in cell wall biosynthesis
MPLPDRAVSLFAGGAQNWMHLDRGIPRYIIEHLRALHALAPEAIDSVVLNPAGPLTGNLNWLLDSGLVHWNQDQRPLGARAETKLPGIYHVMSPFEPMPIDSMWPTWAREPRVATVVTVYDLIPLIFSGHYLSQTRGRVEYRARAELIRHADGVLAISRSTADDVIGRLGVPRERVHVIHAGATGAFASMYGSAEQAERYLGVHLRDVRAGFMFYVGGVEFRKNLERMIEAYSLMGAAVRAAHQLVIACSMLPDQMASLREHGRALGLRDGELVLTGHVTDEVLGALYHACRLFVFPSLYEGSGLPILEAMSCGAPVAASETSTGPEILGDAEATFDPSSADSIARCLTDVVDDPEVLTRLAARSRRRVERYTWAQVAQDTVAAYDAVLESRARRAGASRRPRLALVTPWPPDGSGIADYNLRLAAELGQRVDVQIVVNGPGSSYQVPGEDGVTLVGCTEFDAQRSVRRPDRIVYCMGNSEFHGFVYDMLRRHRGTVVFHDVRLTGFYGWYSGTERPADPAGRLLEWIRALYGLRLPPEASSAVPDWQRQLALGLFMTQDVQRNAEQCLVHSQMARAILELDRDPAAVPVPISVIPFGMPAIVDRRPASATDEPIVVSLGQVSEVKGLEALLAAFGAVSRELPGARLIVAGPAEPQELTRWRDYAAEHAPHARIEIPGAVSVEQYHELLRTADLAVQLRLTSNGEASAAVADCLSVGLPTLVTDIGWLGGLPRNAVVRTELGVSGERLAVELVELLRDPARRDALGAAARDYAAGSSFADVADAYLEALEL